MAITPSDLLYFLTGGAANADPNLSLGGVTSNTQVGTSLHSLFDAVSSAEGAAGDTEYRAIDIKNNHGSETMVAAGVYISQETVSVHTTVALAYDSTGTQSVVNESTAPTAVTFSTPLTKPAGIALGNIAPGATRRIWVRRTVTAGAVPANDSGSLSAYWDTGP
ncbi:hypothetical protein [Candidatus Manganitrophus noduliformans]|uniref:Uncharacterized protein n=1 Tax=Candidatus Manganitrophus noduliformans TaxID=2606439 RepID=A0A7X6DMI1_9BACT|nr:hypothetical protein [Candidatus Manganitrophus noduliformans]NKE69900.1 hypothetical protein [Candidatus Manganitrophus noduliformans]